MNVTLDANIWVAAADPFDPRQNPCNAVLKNIFSNPDITVCSPYLMEVEVLASIARRFRDPVKTENIKRKIRSLPRHKWLILDNRLAAEATRCATSLHLRGADSVYVATAIINNASIITFDVEIINRASPVVEVVTPHGWLWQFDKTGA